MPKLLKLLLLTAIVNSLSWIIIIPLWQYPDEQAHFSQVQNLAEIGYVPQPFNNSKEIDISEEIMDTKRINGNNSYVYHPEYKQAYDKTPTATDEQAIKDLPFEDRKQFVKNESTNNPPLYYFLGALAYKAVYSADLFTRVFAVRLVSITLFLFLIFVTYKIGEQIFKDKPNLQITLAALVAFMPMLVFTSSGVLPDVLTNLLFAIVLYLSLKFINEGIQRKFVILSALTIFIGINSRQQFLIAVPILVSAILIRCLKSRTNLIKLGLLTLAFLVALVVINMFGNAIPIVANFRLPEASLMNPSQLINGKLPWYITWSLQRTYSESLPWYWGVYKWLSLTLPPVTYQMINRLVLVSVIGIVIKFLMAAKRRKVTQQDVLLFYLLAISALYYLLFVVWDYFFYSQKGFSFGFQGRYYFPLIAAHMAIIIIGFREIFRLTLKKYANIGLFLLVILMFFYNNFTLSFLAKAYYSTENLQTFILQTSQYKPSFFKGEIIIALPALLLSLQALFVFSFWKRLNKKNHNESIQRVK